MALLQNEDFLIWQLRTSYLTHNKDGIGERLINVDSSVLNDPSFRAAGWTANIADIKRTYSPPIPTTISSDYFAVPPRSAGIAAGGFGDEEEEGGMVTGRGSTDTVGPGPDVKRRRLREQHDEDDSSDLSDESDEDAEGSRRAAQQIKFAKMPVRNRSGSPPIRSSFAKDGLEVLITSPSRRSNEGRLRSGSLTGVEAVKQKARRDTTTSSEMSSENELDPLVFGARRKQTNPVQAAKAGSLLTEKHEEDERQQMRNLTTTINEDSEAESDRSDLSSESAETADSESLLDDMGASSLTDMPPPLNVNKESPSKLKKAPSSLLQPLPPARPISTIQPVSLLGQALRAGISKPKNPVEAFARLSGKGALDPLNIRIYVPFSESPNKPFEMPLLKNVQATDSGEVPQVTVADAIGLSLWRYCEEGLKPAIDESRLSVNLWVLRMVEDGEVEYDFPPLNRTQPIAAFTSNNNRGPRGRSREKPYDEFALVEATQAQTQENQKLTPKFDKLVEAAKVKAHEVGPQRQSQTEEKETPLATTSPRKPTQAPADKPALPAIHSTPRVGPPKLLKIHFTSLEAFSQISTIEVTTDTYLAEVLDTVCKRWKLDKSYHILKVSGTNTIAPVDRTVESLGARTDLDLVRRRFVNDGALGLAGSLGSSSPNAPLILAAESPAKGQRKGKLMHPLAQSSEMLTITAKYKKYNVIRKQPMSFAPSHQRVLLMDEDYMHILPGETGKTLFDSSVKTSRVPFSMIVGCKVSRRHPKTFRVIIIRERDDTKRYDFEAQSTVDAAEIVEEIRKGMEPYDQQHQAMG
ncbi:MAG: hypothetical protein Q9175_000946 [Cornicularia normoerica]